MMPLNAVKPKPAIHPMMLLE